METVGNVDKGQLFFFILVNPKQFLDIPMKVSDDSRSIFFKKTTTIHQTSASQSMTKLFL